MSVRKRQRGTPKGAGVPQELTRPPSGVGNMVVVAAVRSSAAVIKGRLAQKEVDMMVDSGSSISLIEESVAKAYVTKTEAPPKGLQLVSAEGKEIPVVGCTTLPVCLADLIVNHKFVVVQSLISPIILGIDFLQWHSLVLDFTTSPVSIVSKQIKSDLKPSLPKCVKPLLNAAKVCATGVNGESEDIIDNCAIPLFGKSSLKCVDIPKCTNPLLLAVLEQHRDLFRQIPGQTQLAEHFIPTNGTPVKIPPRRIPAHFRAQVEEQIQAMLQDGIIEKSSSPWMSPAVFVRKKNGDVRICVHYRALNKQTVKDLYPLPLSDEVQDRLAGCTMFSTFDLRSGYWQLPVHKPDQLKTAFCPGPGLGLFQFCRMPFSLTGAPASFQRLMNRICRDLPFATSYLDDVLIHSRSVSEHLQHLQTFLTRLSNAGLTLRGEKCYIGLSKVKYLGHLFSAKGMEPDPEKIAAVRDWSTPCNVTELRSFLGLASYYRRYIRQFADIATPLHALTNTGVAFVWTSECQVAVEALKKVLTEVPILAYPNFAHTAVQFQLHTDASATGLGVVLEQGDRVIAYASRTLTTAEKNYSVIQRECLAIIFALKQFRHYLIGRRFTLLTDHAPLQWLAGQKMEGLLARWALSMQEFDFAIVYRKSTENGNADALSRKHFHSVEAAAATSCSPNLFHLYQHSDPVVRQLHDSLLQSHTSPKGHKWHRHPLRRYRQIWSQLLIQDGIVFRQYTPGPTADALLVPIVPTSLQTKILQQCHDAVSAGHVGPQKTAEKVRKLGY